MPASENKKRPPVLYVFFGLIATGKSTLAQAWARHKQAAHYNSDRVRKELAGISPTTDRREAIDAGIYSREYSRKTYQALLERAAARLRRGESVILDASYQHARDRRAVKELAEKLHCRLYFILCRCSEEEMKRRMAAREMDPAAVSDGRWEIYLQQKERFEAPDELDDMELVVMETEAPPAALVRELAERLP